MGAKERGREKRAQELHSTHILEDTELKKRPL
jgi:hypothetical protein